MQLPESGSRRSRGPLSGTHLLQYLSLRLPAFSRFRTLLLVLLLKLLNPVTSLLSYAPFMLKITECIEYKLISLTYKVLTTTHHPCLHNLISVQPHRSTRSSSLVTLARPPTLSSLRITDRSFRRKQLLISLRQPHSTSSVSHLPVHAPTTSSHLSTHYSQHP